MVNYCCVFGCGRNSKSSKHLYYYSVPKEPCRQEQWLESAGRADLLEKPPEKRILYRFCSRHFTPSSFKNKHLCADAVPTLYLPGSPIAETAEDSNDGKQMHPNISCNNCGISITGFRYKCITCPMYDLCSRCEMTETHSQHFMLRIPAPAKFKNIENVMKKLQEYYKESNRGINDDSSDDEPITKYVKNYDSGIDLTDDVKESIRKEVTRVLNQNKSCEARKKKKVNSRKRSAETDKASKIQKIETVDLTALFSNAPGVVFADMNEVYSVGGNQLMDVKTELSVSLDNNIEEPALPMMEMKLSDDLSELMMEVSDQKSTF